MPVYAMLGVELSFIHARQTLYQRSHVPSILQGFKSPDISHKNPDLQLFLE